MQYSIYNTQYVIRCILQFREEHSHDERRALLLHLTPEIAVQHMTALKGRKVYASQPSNLEPLKATAWGT